MSRVLRAAVVLILLCVGTLFGENLKGQQTTLRLVQDEVMPTEIQPGQIALRRIVVDAPDGVPLAFPEEMPSGPTTEAARTVRVLRQAEQGRVRWVLSYGFTAWEEGPHTTEGLRIAAQGRPGIADLVLGGLPLRVTSPLPDARRMRPAAAENPLPVGVPPWAYLPLIPLLLSVVTGAAWRKRAAAAAPVVQRRDTPARPAPTLEEVLTGTHDDGRLAAVAVAAAARRHPAVTELGGRAWHTTPEVLAHVGEKLGMEAGELLRRVLHSGDAAGYGGASPDPEAVLTSGRELLGVLDRV